jgi:hypothetical protein
MNIPAKYQGKMHFLSIYFIKFKNCIIVRDRELSKKNNSRATLTMSSAGNSNMAKRSNMAEYLIFLTFLDVHIEFLPPRIRDPTLFTLKKRSILRIMHDHVTFKRLMASKFPLWTFWTCVHHICWTPFLNAQMNDLDVIVQRFGRFVYTVTLFARKSNNCLVSLNMLGQTGLAVEPLATMFTNVFRFADPLVFVLRVGRQLGGWIKGETALAALGFGYNAMYAFQMLFHRVSAAIENVRLYGLHIYSSYTHFLNGWLQMWHGKNSLCFVSICVSSWPGVWHRASHLGQGNTFFHLLMW